MIWEISDIVCAFTCEHCVRTKTGMGVWSRMKLYDIPGDVDIGDAGIYESLMRMQQTPRGVNTPWGEGKDE